MSNNKLLLKFAKPYPAWIVLTIFLGFSGALFNGISTTLIVPVILSIVGQQVDLSNAPGVIKLLVNPFDNLPISYRLIVMGGAIVLTILLKNIATYCSVLTSSVLSRRLTSDIREAGIKLLLEVDLDYYSKTKVGDLVNRLGGETARVASAIGSIIKLFILVITILVFVSFLLLISWQLTVATTGLLAFVTLINQYAIARAREFGRLLSTVSTSYSVAILETLTGIRLVKATGNEEREYTKLKGLIREREKADFLSQVYSEAIAPTSEVAGITALILIVFLARTFFAAQVSAVSTVLLTYLLILLRLLPLISQLNSLRSGFANTSASVDIVAEFLTRQNKPFMSTGKILYQKLEREIQFHDICFSYPSSDKLILRNVTLSLPRGTTLALVGGSGAGKSTMAYLLPRFYDPTSGYISLDGVDLRELDLNSLRKVMGIVSQDTFLFNDSVRNNIAYGRIEATDEEILIAAKRANAYEFISKLAQGFETQIGDRGVMLSGGQRQRLAIARALLQNPDILVLDEATSALDSVSERLVQAALDELSRDRTTLVIAHRLSTIQNADQIAVLEQGTVVEVGKHEELLAKGGYYSRLYSMQFSDHPTTKKKHSQSLLNISHEIRTQLNSMIGLLRLLMDGLIDNAQEREELVEESYRSTWRVLSSLDILDDIFNLQNKHKPFANETDLQNPTSRQDQNLRHITDNFRTGIYPLLSSLRLLVNNINEYSLVEQNELIAEGYKFAIELLDTLEQFENSTV